MKTTLYFMLIALFSFTSCKTEYIDYNQGAVEVESDIFEANVKLLSPIPCSPFLKCTDEYYYFTDAGSPLVHFLKPNVLCKQSRTEKIIYPSDGVKYFAYAYQDTLNKCLKIVLSNAFLKRDFNQLTCNIELDSSYTITFVNKEKKRAANYFTKKSRIILNKNKFEIGDTISGKIIYQGLEPFAKITTWYFEFNFSCRVGKGYKFLDYYNDFNVCEGKPIFEGSGLETRRNIIGKRNPARN
jgi:hypothetical protein